MDFNQFLQSAAYAGLKHGLDSDNVTGPVDLSRAAAIEVNKDLYLEAEARGLSLSEILELDEFDPTSSGCQLDAFERQHFRADVESTAASRPRRSSHVVKLMRLDVDRGV